MSPIAPPGVTGRIGVEEWSAVHRLWLDDEPTGYEYGHAASLVEFVSNLWGFEREAGDPAAAPAGGTDDLRGRAASLAAEVPHVATIKPTVPALSGNLAEDVHLLCGLTWRQIADVFGISERAVAGWKAQGVPAHRVESMEALRAIGAMLAGGLEPDGVSAWLGAGEPSRLERLRDGEWQAVGAEADSYLDTPAT